MPPAERSGGDLAGGARALDKFRRTSTTEQVERVLREAIVAGELSQGEQIREIETAQQLGIGRGPIREALRHLEQEGLVAYELHRGTFVKVVSAADVLDIYTTRMAIETEVAQLLIDMPGDVDFTEVKALLEVLREADSGDDAPSSRLVQADIALHEAIIALAGSPRLSRIFHTLSAEMRMYLLHNHPPYARTRYVQDHEELVAAIVERRPEAPDVVRAHLSHAREFIVAAMSEGESDLPPPNQVGS